MRELRSEELDALKSKIREHPAFHGGPADAEDCLDFLQVTLAKFGKYELMDECLADWCERQWPIMDEARFNRLVEYARHNFVDYRRDEWETPAKSWAYNYRILPARGKPEFLRNLLSGKGKLEWDALSLIAQEHLNKGTALPPELAAWVVEVLAGRKPRPSTGAQSTSTRDRMIYLAVYYMAMRFDLTPTRNTSKKIGGKTSDYPHCCFEGGSACDVVGEAAGVTYKTAEGAWTNRDPILS